MVSPIRQRRGARGRTARPVAVGLIALATIAAASALATRLAPPRASAATPGPVLPALVTPETQRSINDALAYLVRTQRQDGSWICGGYGGYDGYKATMASLAGMAMMANGSTPEEGPYARPIRRAMNYVLDQAHGKEGLIASAGSARPMYDHGFSMLFLAMCYGADLNEATEQRIHDALTRAVALTADSQVDLGRRYHHAGGWYYWPGQNRDEGSITITQLQALRACRNAGITVPKATIDRAVTYLRLCQMPDGGIRYDARGRGRSLPGISAAALACFYAAGVYDRRDSDETAEGRMMKRLWEYMAPFTKPGPVDSGMWRHWYYRHFYLAQALYQRGGEPWPTFYQTIAGVLREEQNLDGSWSGGVGSAYRTSIAAIILQLPYNYLPICQR